MNRHRGWLDAQLSSVIACVRELRPVLGIAPVIAGTSLPVGPRLHAYLHYRRGELQVTLEQHQPGYERAIFLPIPHQKSDDDLREWLVHELKGVPCYP